MTPLANTNTVRANRLFDEMEREAPTPFAGAPGDVLANLYLDRDVPATPGTLYRAAKKPAHYGVTPLFFDGLDIDLALGQLDPGVRVLLKCTALWEVKTTTRISFFTPVVVYYKTGRYLIPTDPEVVLLQPGDPPPLDHVTPQSSENPDDMSGPDFRYFDLGGINADGSVAPDVDGNIFPSGTFDITINQ